jgi:hypothetical protein
MEWAMVDSTPDRKEGTEFRLSEHNWLISNQTVRDSMPPVTSFNCSLQVLSPMCTSPPPLPSPHLAIGRIIFTSKGIVDVVRDTHTS